MSSFDLLSDDSIRDIALHLSLPEINYLGLTNSRFNRIICRDEGFWRLKFIYDFDFNPIDYRGSWLQLYQRYGNVWLYPTGRYEPVGSEQDKKIDKPTRIQNINLLGKAKQVSIGVTHTVLIDIHNNVWSWGSNKYGELGLGHTQDQSVPTKIPNFRAKQVSAGHYNTIIIDLDNNVWVCGFNINGQLGLGDKSPRYVLTPIPNFRAKQVSTGRYHTLFIDLENNVWVCGDNACGQLGLGDYQCRYIPTPIPDINLLGKAKQVAVGWGHTFIIDLNDNVWVCGWNSNGQLGLGDTLSRNKPTIISNINLLGKAKQISSGSDYTIILDRENNVWVCGNQEQALIPIRIPNIKAKQVSWGPYQIVIIDLDNNVWTCGRNDGGQLGLGDNQNRQVLTQISNIKAQQVSCGYYHTVIIEM